MKYVRNKIIKPLYYVLMGFFFVMRRKVNYYKNILIKNKNKNAYTFAILCIKKIAYADMVIVNINSLHALNNNHTFCVYSDSICYEYLKKKLKKFDYPEKIKVIDSFGKAEKPWQYYKIEVHIEASRNEQIDTDADGIWHADPIIDRTRITMMANGQRFCDDTDETSVLQNIFPNYPEWVNYKHCVAAFLSMPKQFMNPAIEQRMREVNDAILTNPLDFINDDSRKHELKRLSEEFAVNIAIQSTYSADILVVLKKSGGWGDREILQPLYYGLENKINE